MMISLFIFLSILTVSLCSSNYVASDWFPNVLDCSGSAVVSISAYGMCEQIAGSTTAKIVTVTSPNSGQLIYTTQLYNDLSCSSPFGAPRINTAPVGQCSLFAGGSIRVQSIQTSTTSITLVDSAINMVGLQTAVECMTLHHTPQMAVTRLYLAATVILVILKQCILTRRSTVTGHAKLQSNHLRC